MPHSDAGFSEWMEKISTIDPTASADIPTNRFTLGIQQGKLKVNDLLLALNSPDPEIRLDASEILGQIRASQALSALKEVALHDSDGSVRQVAAISVVQIGGDELLGEVTKNLRHDDPEVIAHAAVTLGKIGDSRVVPNLLQAFQTEDIIVGSAIAWALGRLGDARAISWLGAALENGFVPANAAEALGRIGDIEAIPILIRTLHNNPNEDARAYSARALGMMREPPGLRGVRAQSWLTRKDEMLQALENSLDEDPSNRVRLFAALALFELGQRSAGRSFVDIVKRISK